MEENELVLSNEASPSARAVGKHTWLRSISFCIGVGVFAVLIVLCGFNRSPPVFVNAFIQDMVIITILSVGACLVVLVINCMGPLPRTYGGYSVDNRFSYTKIVHVLPTSPPPPPVVVAPAPAPYRRRRLSVAHG